MLLAPSALDLELILDNIGIIFQSLRLHVNVNKSNYIIFKKNIDCDSSVNLLGDTLKKVIEIK